MKRGSKKGQFYLIAAIIISVIIISFITLSNYSKKQEFVRLYDIGEELKIESEKVLDFGTYNGYNQNQVLGLMENFSNDYINYVQEGKDSYFLFGNNNQITVVGYSQSDTTIYVNAGSGENQMNINGGEITSQEFNSTGDNITIKIEDVEHQFELKSGENFYFVISDNIGGEKHVVRN